ncbi:helix-turn-helix domain-containing protein [Sphingomonas sp. NSE70-1]|uniref:Helix-turn-helix domain-containing protein n=1 Tax=Sphingomonas caseinilyticus TaxID=2908205 RepID=A0ABT0RQU3_9SPHN|nr:helix-turn-helix domain-containing protein [Sphingomonas caseinilyticus]MCL6697281.1 helix-turn-helix domain-containing protein [Sphingomonas caseinilyticus]
MARFIHPDLKDVPLESMLHALSDPSRLAIVRCLNRNLADGGAGLACNAAVTEELPRATMSNHFTLLRGAGLIESRKKGVSVINRLRRDEVDARFPGLLDAVLGATGQGL